MINKEQLQGEIVYCLSNLYDSGKDKEYKEKALAKLHPYFKDTKIIRIFNDTQPMQILCEEELYHIAKFFIECGITDIKLSDYYNDSEITDCENYRVEEDVKYEGTLKLKNVLLSGTTYEPEYVTTMTYKDIARLTDGLIQYNFETQRQAEIVKIRDRITRLPYINLKSVEEIKQSILDKTFKSNTLTINLRGADEHSVIYGEVTDELLIDLNRVSLDMIDGYHRASGISLAYKEDNTIEGRMTINFKMLSPSGCRFFIAQESKGNINNKEIQQLYDVDSNVCRLIDAINRNNSLTNILKGAITMGSKSENTLVLHDIFSRHLLQIWTKEIQESSPAQLLEISNFICDFYYESYEVLKKKFKCKNISDLKCTIALDQMFLSGLLYPAHQLYTKNKGIIDTEIIKKMVNKIDLKTEIKENLFTYDSNKNRYRMKKYKDSWENVLKL